jgi:hypothetical protein
VHLPWHGRNFAWFFEVFDDKERVNELLWLDTDLADHFPQATILAKPPWALNWKTHVLLRFIDFAAVYHYQTGASSNRS